MKGEGKKKERRVHEDYSLPSPDNPRLDFNYSVYLGPHKVHS